MSQRSAVIQVKSRKRKQIAYVRVDVESRKMAQANVFAGQAEKPRQRNYIVFILDSSLTPLLS